MGGGTTAIDAPASTGVTLNIDGAIETATSPAIDLGSGATINLTPTGSLHAAPAGGSVGFTLPDIFAGSVVDEATLNVALAPAIGVDSVSNSFATPLVRLGAPVDISADSNSVTGVVTVGKAMLADTAMSSITAYINSAAQPGAPAFGIGGQVVSASSNFVNNQGDILSSGSAGILGLDGSANRLLLDNGTLVTDVSGSAAYRLAGTGATEIVVTNGSTLATLFNNSAAIDLGGAGSASVVQIVDSQLYTLGDSSAAISGTATNSVLALEIRGRTGRLPTLGTFGDNSAGVRFQGTGSSSAVINVVDAGSNAFGAGVRTHGNDSTLFDLSTGGSSSISFSATDSTFSTAGSNSRVASLLTGDTSDVLISLRNTSLASEGANSGLVTYRLGNGSVADFVGIDLTLTSTGDGAGGVLREGTGNAVSDSLFLGRTQISTFGNDAPGLWVANGGINSARSATIDDSAIATQGDRSPGYSLGGLGNGSAISGEATDVTITTVGNDSPGFFQGAAGASSAANLTATNLAVTTQGDRSTAVEFGGAIGNGSVANLEVDSSSLSTAGANSAGLVWRDLLRSSSTATGQITASSVSTQGQNSPGVVLNEQTGSVHNGGSIENSSLSLSVENLTVTTDGDNSEGLLVNGLGANSTGADQLFFAENLDITTNGNNSRAAIFNTGFANSDGSISNTVIAGSQFRTNGDHSDGFVLNSGTGALTSPTSSHTTFVGSIDVVTTGVNSDGIVIGPGIGEANGMASVNAFMGAGLSASTSGANSNALVISENTFVSDGDTATYGSIIDSFDHFVATGAGGRAIQNNGTIHGGADGLMLGAGVRGNIANSGTITSSGPNAITYDTAANSDDIFELQPGGVVNGNVLAGKGNDQFILGGEGTDSFDHALLGTQYQGFDALIKEDGSSWTIMGADSGAAFVPTTVTGGTLILNANLTAMEIAVQSGGRLEGSGSVGMVANSGTFSPGGLGHTASFSVSGDLNLAAGGVTEIDIQGDGGADQITVGGTATVGGQLAVNGVMYPTGFPQQRSYVVLTSPGDVLGTFDSVVDNLPDVDAMVTILPATGPLDPDDPNRPGSVVISYERAGDDSDKSILSNSAQFAGQSGLAFIRTLQRRANSQRYDMSPDDRGYSFWQTGLGEYYDINSSSTATGYHSGLGGYAAGVDQLVNTPEGFVRYGLGTGYVGGSLTSGPSSAQLNSAQFGAYASMQRDAWLFAGTFGYGWLDYDIDRGIPLPGSSNQITASGDPHGDVFALSFEASYDLAAHLGNTFVAGMRVAPIVRYEYLNAQRNGYNESGASLLDLSVDSARYATDLVSLGLEVGNQIQTFHGVQLSWLSSLRYERLIGSQNATSTAILTNIGGAPFIVPGALVPQDRVVFGCGVGADLTPNVSTQFRYDASVGNDISAHRGSVELTVRF